MKLELISAVVVVLLPLVVDNKTTVIAEIDPTSFPEQDLKQSRNLSTLYAPGANL